MRWGKVLRLPPWFAADCCFASPTTRKVSFTGAALEFNVLPLVTLFENHYPKVNDAGYG
jgi:hypothetical protein